MDAFQSASLSAFIAPAVSLHSFISPADTAAGLISPAYAAQQPPVAPASSIDAPTVATSNSDAAAAVLAEFPAPFVQSLVAVNMANIAPHTVTI